MNLVTACAVTIGVLAAAMATPPRARASVITATLPATLAVAPATLGTFAFTIPAGEAATSATVLIGGLQVAFANSGTFYLDGVTLGTAALNRSGSDVTFALGDPSVLNDGSATLTFAATDFVVGCPCVITTGETLTITTTVQEPATMTLLGAALIGLGALRRRVT